MPHQQSDIGSRLQWTWIQTFLRVKTRKSIRSLEVYSWRIAGKESDESSRVIPRVESNTLSKTGFEYYGFLLMFFPLIMTIYQAVQSSIELNVRPNENYYISLIRCYADGNKSSDAWDVVNWKAAEFSWDWGQYWNVVAGFGILIMRWWPTILLVCHPLYYRKHQSSSNIYLDYIMFN